MRRQGFRLELGLVVAFLLLALVVAALPAAAQGQGTGRKIVVFNERLVNERAQAALLQAHGASLDKPVPLLNGWAVSLPPAAGRALARRMDVARIEEDVEVFATNKPTTPPPPPADPQVVPWGISRVGAPAAWGYSTGAGVNVAILDTGIDSDHPDLAVAGGLNAIAPRKSWDDDNGHGTHVAGIVAALNNSRGVVGVAPGASLYAVKVLDRRGSGYLSTIINGLTWCINTRSDGVAGNDIGVVNMSFGASSSNQSFYQAIAAAHAAGIVLVAAAGNSYGRAPVDYPAAYGECLAVSATDYFNQLANFSSWGSAVALAAPGDVILSTYKGGGYASMSGTSMATPHVTGVVALRLALYPYESPEEVRRALEAAALDLGAPGVDRYFGAGLVQALGALVGP